MRMYAYFGPVGHDHAHGPGLAHAESASAKYVVRLALALGIGLAVMLAEGAVAIATGSLALLSDAAHVFTDVLGIGMALTAILFAKRSRPTFSRTFGYFIEVSAQNAPILPYGLELLPVERETLRVGRRIVLLARLVQTHKQGKTITQLEKT